MSIFPVTGQVADPGSLPIYREWAYDFARGRIATGEGEAKLLEGAEALKVWVYKALLTQADVFPAYSPDFGCYLEDIIGENPVGEDFRADVEMIIRTALLQSPYILGVQDVTVDQTETGQHAIACVVETVYGIIEVEVSL